MLERNKNVMVRFTEPELLQVREAWSKSDAQPWRRIPFAEWCRRTLLQLCPAERHHTEAAARIKPAKRRRTA